MAKQTLHLEIVRVWWMWRGCLQDYYDGCDTEDIHEDHVGWDAMDLNGYEETSAFPVQKPNFDVFGIPRRTRSQRGWYQVQRRANAKPHGPSVSLPPSDAPATGADLPWELVELVGEMMSERLSWSEDDDRRTMIACALVCRYWARHFLAKIFENTTLRSRRRAYELWELDRSPACWFQRCVKPWVYLQLKPVQLACVHLLTRHSNKGLYLTGPLPPGWATLRSVHQALPRTLPSSMSRNITLLVLANVRFRRFADLVHLVGELPELWQLACTKVVWGPLPATVAMGPPLRRRQNKRHGQLEVMMDSDAWAQASVHILVHVLSRETDPFFTARELPAILALALLVESMFRTTLASDDATDDDPDPSVFSGKVCYCGNKESFSLQWSHMPHFARMRMEGIPRAGPDGEPHVLDGAVKFIIDLGAPLDAHSPRWRALDWHAFAAQVAVLASTHPVFRFASVEQMLAFGDVDVDARRERYTTAGGLDIPGLVDCRLEDLYPS